MEVDSNCRWQDQVVEKEYARERRERLSLGAKRGGSLALISKCEKGMQGKRKRLKAGVYTALQTLREFREALAGVRVHRAAGVRRIAWLELSFGAEDVVEDDFFGFPEPWVALQTGHSFDCPAS